MKAESWMKAYFFFAKDPISITVLLTTFNFVCNRNHFYGGPKRWVLPHYINETMVDEFNSCIYSDKKFIPISASLCNKDARSRKLLHSYLEVTNYLLKKFTAEQPLVDFDGKILCYMQPTNVTLQQYVYSLVLKNCNGANCKGASFTKLESQILFLSKDSIY